MTDDFKKGDRVRVTVEGIARVYDGDYFEVTYAGAANGFRRSKVASVEVLPPPVEQFKPGDLVRHRLSHDVIAIARDGWCNLTQGSFTRWGTEWSYNIKGYVTQSYFNSERYERVELK